MDIVEDGDMKIVEITPEMGRWYLAQDCRNRRLNTRAVRELVAAMLGRL